MNRNCSHAYGMIFDDDYCCCKICKTEWHLTPQGWLSPTRPIPKMRYNNDAQRVKNYKANKPKTSR